MHTQFTLLGFLFPAVKFRSHALYDIRSRRFSVYYPVHFLQFDKCLPVTWKISEKQLLHIPPVVFASCNGDIVIQNFLYGLYSF